MTQDLPKDDLNAKIKTRSIELLEPRRDWITFAILILVLAIVWLRG